MKSLGSMFGASGRLLCAAVLVAAHLSAGQSLTLAASQSIDVADPAYPPGQPWRVEFEMHDWTPPASGIPRMLTLNGVGVAAFMRSDGLLSLESSGDRTTEQAPCFVSVAGIRHALVRLQRDTAGMKFSCELWNIDSTGYQTMTRTLSQLGNTPFTGGTLGGGLAVSLGFVRVFTTLLPLGSRPPVTGNTGDWTELRLDGNLSDASGKSHGGTGTALYRSTPDQVPVAAPKTLGAPFWSNWTSLRAGYPARLDGSDSYTMADGNAGVTYDWQQLSGPSTVIWQDRLTARPTITGLIFGTYSFRLQVRDAAGGTASATLQLGAVATDPNGVVVHANPAADVIFGPMIAFGKNPWAFADERNLRMENLQKDAYANPPSWATPLESARVDYTYFDPYGTPAKTNLAQDISAGAMSLPVTSLGTLDLSSFPTQILVGTQGAWEIVRICSASGSTLQVCYDGRGYHYGLDGSYIRPASAWSSGTRIWQAKVKGSGTHFLSTLCSLGPGWQVAATQPAVDTGAATVAPGSASITGTGTSWTNTTVVSRAIAIFAKHGGTPFTFFAYVSGIGGQTLTLSRPFPADADAGSYSYKVFSDQRRVVLEYTRTDATKGSVYFPTAGCETDTDLYLYMGWDNAYQNQHVSSSPYSFMDGLGYAGDFSTNFYDIGLAHYAFYFRSGLTQSLTAARQLEDYWLRYPELAQGDAGGPPRRMSVLGTFAAAVLDGDRAANWSGLRSYARTGLSVALRKNCGDDLRETAYELSWLSMAALFDPDPAQRAQWQAGVAGAAYTRDLSCKKDDDSFASPFYWNPGSQQITATQGSTTATVVSGTVPGGMCYSTAHGTALASTGSALLTTITGSFIPPSGSFKLIVGGTKGGARYELATQFHFNSAGSLTMAALWSGDSGNVYWSIENNDNLGYMLTVAEGPDDTANFGKVTSCYQTDSTHIQFYRPWPSASGVFKFFSYNLVGNGTQPFMAGIKALQMRYAGQVHAPYKTLDEGVSRWVGTTGFDTATKGLYYGRVFPQCEPAATDSGITDTQFRVTGCIENSNNLDYVKEARARNAEAQNAMTVMYLSSPTDANRTLGDMFYGAAYGAAGYTAPGYWSDGITASNLTDSSLGSYKWPGFFFGVGMAHQWPAARVGGVTPPRPRTVYVSFKLTPGRTARITVTAPSGATSAFQCGTTSPCPVSVDDRQGSHWYQVQYLSDAGKVVAQSSPDLIAGIGN